MTEPQHSTLCDRSPNDADCSYCPIFQDCQDLQKEVKDLRDLVDRSKDNGQLKKEDWI